MAITFERQSYSGRFPEIWRGECKMLPGGFKPAQEFAVGTVVRRATPMQVDFDTMSAKVCKLASVLNGGTTTKVRIAKGHYFVVGEKVFKHGETTLVTINEIDRSNAAYDVLTLSAALAGIKKDDVILEGVDDSGTKPACVPNMILGADKHFDGKGIPTLDAAYEAVVLIPALSFPVLSDWVQGVALKNNPNIIFIKQ